jgi:hypothetical protein
MAVPQPGRGQPGAVAGLVGVAVALAMAVPACTSAQSSSTAAAGGSRPAVLAPLPAGTTSQHPGYLVYRIYLPAGGASAVPLPVLTVEQGGAARTLPACPSHNAPVTFPAHAPAAGAGGSGAAVPPPLEFCTAQQSFSDVGLSNVDTSHVYAYLGRPPAPDVVVVTRGAGCGVV